MSINSKKQKGIIILIKNNTGTTLGNIETVDDNIMILNILTESIGYSCNLRHGYQVYQTLNV